MLHELYINYGIRMISEVSAAIDSAVMNKGCNEKEEDRAAVVGAVDNILAMLSSRY